jgi:NitT/TauT family transport system ATP-binding protein
MKLETLRPAPQTSSPTSFLIAENLHLAYPQKDGAPTKVLDGISFDVGVHETVAVVGPNGCGKTTLLLTLAGLLSVDQGRISINGKSPQEAPVGLVFQNYRESLLPWRTVEDNIAFSLEVRGTERRERRAAIGRFLQGLDINVPLNRYPYQLSGGQQQTVSILRTLIADPDLILLDEPFASLDYRARINMHEKVQEIFLNTKQTAILVSHEIDEAILLSDRVLVLSHRPARILADVSVKFSKPRPRELVLTEDFLQIKREIFKYFPV